MTKLQLTPDILDLEVAEAIARAAARARVTVADRPRHLIRKKHKKDRIKARMQKESRRKNRGK